MRVEFNGERVADSERTLVDHETRLPPAYYFPAEDVRMDLLAKTEFTTHCPFKGNASYWTLKVGDHVAENAARAYEEPYREAEKIRGYLSFYRNKISGLYEGEDEVPFAAAKNSPPRPASGRSALPALPQKELKWQARSVPTCRRCATASACILAR